MFKCGLSLVAVSIEYYLIATFLDEPNSELD